MCINTYTLWVVNNAGLSGQKEESWGRPFRLINYNLPSSASWYEIIPMHQFPLFCVLRYLSRFVWLQLKLLADCLDKRQKVPTFFAFFGLEKLGTLQHVFSILRVTNFLKSTNKNYNAEFELNIDDNLFYFKFLVGDYSRLI